MMVLTFILVSAGRILFRAQNVAMAGDFFSHICDKSLFCFDNIIGKWPLLLCVGLVIVEWIQRDKQHVLQLTGGVFKLRWVRWTLYLGIALFTLLGQGAQQDFIYFQF